MKGDYQELVDEISALLGAPATLENRDFGLVAFGAHDSDDDTAMDPVRTRSILTRRSTPAVRAWFEGFGITRATGPVRIPAAPEAGVFRDRICLPVRHRGVVLGYVWLLDADPGPTDERLAAAMDVAARIGALLADEERAGADLSREFGAVLVAGRGWQRDMAVAALRDALGADADGAAHGGVRDPLAAARRPPSVRCRRAAALATVRRRRRAGPRRPGPAALRRGPGPGARRPRSGCAIAARARRDRRASPPPAGAWTELADSWHEALAAARAAAAEPRFGPVADWSAIGPYRLLAALPRATDRAPDPAVRPAAEPRAHANWPAPPRCSSTAPARRAGRPPSWASTARRSTTGSPGSSSSPAST